MAIEVIGDSARGDEYAVARLLVEGERIVEADVPGLERELAGLTMLQAAAVTGPTLAVDALADALGRVFRAAPAAGRVAVAMSGGVDSTVALLRARPAAVGVTLRLWADPHGRSAERICCSPEAVLAARRTCHELGVPHVTLDLREPFQETVVRPFVDGYARGLTPNPCSRCNGAFRFAELVTFAARAGAGTLWTGHYARVVERAGRRLVARGRDAAKDQSYMLGTVDPALLQAVSFPLGGSTKPEIREEALAAGVSAARRPESQEACFLAGDDYRAFLERQGLRDDPGAIVDEGGRELGRHHGLWRFTPGQRRGLGLAAREPLYVVRGDPATRSLVVGPRRALQATSVDVAGRLYEPVTRVEAQLRYRSAPVPATVTETAEGFRLALEQPFEAAAPGQTAVLYDADVVVGAGTIVRAG